MDISQVEADLQQRIQESKDWLASNPIPIKGVPFRGHTWNAVPDQFLDDPNRVERYGLSFDFVLDHPEKHIAVKLVVRIKPDSTAGSKGDSPPYVVIYVVNQSSQTEESVGWHHIEVADSYGDLIGVPIQDWFKKWIRHGLTCKGHSKILKPEMRVTN